MSNTKNTFAQHIYSAKNGEYIDTRPILYKAATSSLVLTVHRDFRGTTVEPPVTGENEVAVFDETKQEWSVKSDYRGEKYWTEADGVIQIINIDEKPEKTWKRLNDGDEVIQDGSEFRLKSEDDWIKEKQQLAIAAIKQVASSVRANVAGNADAYELAGWAVKAERALRYKSGNATPEDTVILQQEVDKRSKGESVDELVEKQLNKATRLGVAVAIIDGLSDKLFRDVETKKTIKSLDDLINGLRNKFNNALV